MNDVSLEEVLALNEELAALSAAGVPIELGAGNVSTEETLANINASLALRTSLGQPVGAALAADDKLPTVYQNALLTGLQTNQLSLALDGVSRQPIAWDDLRRTVGQALVGPLIVLTLAYCGFIFLCLLFGPTLASVYEQMREPPSWGVRLLTFGREWMPVWVPLVPLLVLLAIFLWRRRVHHQRPWLPGSSRYFATITRATFAEQLASLLTANVPLPESLRLAGKSTNDPGLIAASERIASVRERNEPLTPADEQQLSVLPPLLRWALTGNLGGESLPDMLRFIAETYRQSAQRQATVWHLALPTFVGAIVGGAIVLVYGLSMFGPYIQMLRDLAY
ncbi:MAG: type II secretion system F family protein [Bythopirellula sp.]|nr:type II secretion system F family protein [Bythopirellula sp.]